MSVTLRHGHFIGALRQSRRVAGLTLAETEYEPGLRVAAHAHDHALCCLVLDGSFTERAGSRSRTLSAGGVLFHPEDEAHSHQFHGPTRCFNVQFSAAWMDRMRSLGVVWPADPLTLRPGKVSWLAAQLHREFRASDAASQLAIEGFALALLGEMARAPVTVERGQRPRWLARAVELLHARFGETVSMAGLARELEVHPTHLARTFRQFHGCTMGEYLRGLRIEAAKRELLTTAKPLSAIAHDAGFADQAHFSRVFKQATGATPGSFRRTGGAR